MAQGGKRSSFDLNSEEASYLASVVNYLREFQSVTKPEVTIHTGMSRTLVTKYIEIGTKLRLLKKGEKGPSSGGRAPQMLNFNSKAGTILVAELGATGLSVAASDLNGNLEGRKYISIDIAKGPQVVLATVEELFDEIIKKLAIKNLWGIGIGVPGPVEFATGLPVSPPIMPGWDKFPIRAQFSQKYKAPVWVDNDVNLMALGEHVLRKDPITNELIFVKIGSGIGAGILSHGRIHRGAQGSAGDIGHIALPADSKTVCRCGNIGCLEAVSGGVALVRDAQIAASNNQSSYMATLKKANKIDIHDVIKGVNSGDRWCVERINKVGNDLGSVLATIVNFHNPSLIVLGGSVSGAGDKLLASVRETVLKRSLPLATRDLQIRISEFSNEAGLMGAVEMVIGELFSAENLKNWVALGYPSPSILA